MNQDAWQPAAKYMQVSIVTYLYHLSNKLESVTVASATTAVHRDCLGLELSGQRYLGVESFPLTKQTKRQTGIAQLYNLTQDL